MKRSTSRRAAALLTLTLGLALSAPAVTVAHDGHSHANKAPKVKAQITLSPIGDKLVGAKIPIKGYLSGNSEKAKKVITLQQKINGKWKVKATKRQKANGAYKLRAQVVKKAGKVKYRTTVSYKGKVLDKSGTVRVKVIKNPNTEEPTPTTDTLAPAAPTGLTVTAGDSRVVLTWNANKEVDFANYIVYHSLPGGTATETNTTATSIAITGLKNGTEYFFSLRAKDKAGNLSSKSAVVSATPVPAVQPDTTPPPVPTGLTAIPGDGSVTLNWTGVTAADLDGYIVFRSTSGSAAIETPTKATTLTVPGLTNGTEYYFTVKSVDKSGNASAKSNEAAATPAAALPLTEKRVIDGAKRCQTLQVVTLNQERSSTDGGVTWTPWATVSEGLREAAAVDCLNIVPTWSDDVLFPDLRMRNLDVCSAAEKARDTDAVQDCFRIVNPAPAVAGFPNLTGRKLLKFPILTLNVGAGPSEVIADRSGAPSTWTAYQTFYDAEGNRESVATDADFYFAGDGHDHWHIRDFDNYTVTADGIERSAEKHGYCLEDNTTYGGMAGQPGVPSAAVYDNARVCGKGLPNALTIVHGMSKGWGDTYPSTLPDQALDVTELPDGTYTITVIADDKDVLTESDNSNNSASVQVTIVGDTATVVPGTATGGIP